MMPRFAIAHSINEPSQSLIATTVNHVLRERSHPLAFDAQNQRELRQPQHQSASQSVAAVMPALQRPTVQHVLTTSNATQLNNNSNHNSNGNNNNNHNNNSSDDDDNEPNLSTSMRMLSATIGALITSLVVTPFDVVKTRLQAQMNHKPLPLATVANVRPAIHYSPLAPQHIQFGPMLASTAIRDGGSCLHYRLHTGLMDVWCHRCENSSAGVIFSGASAINANATGGANATQQGAAAAAQRFNGSMDALSKLVKHEGLSSLWRGLPPTLLLSIPSTVVYFALYDKLKLSLQQLSSSLMIQRRLERHNDEAVHRRAAVLHSIAPLLAGTTARATTTILVSPLELIRTRTQASHVTQRMSMLAMLQQELAKGGLRSLWRGVNPTLWRDVPFSAIYWTSYEAIKHRAVQHIATNMQHSAQHKFQQQRSAQSGMSGVNSPSVLHHHASQNSFMQMMSYDSQIALISFASGASSGMLAAALTHPFDLVKTRRQIELYHMMHAAPGGLGAQNASTAATSSSASSAAAQPKLTTSSTLSVLQTIVRQEGYKGLMNGLGARIGKIAPACAIMISSYEIAKIKLV